jgi:nucleoside-diphosphate-sugar epimerase
MRLLFIGGTGLISSACSDLAVAREHELFLLNRGISAKHSVPNGASLLKGDLRGDPASLAPPLARMRFDAVVDFLAFTPEEVEQHLRLVQDKTEQFVFISSASAYQKPPASYVIREDTPLDNPFWQYSRGKIECERSLMRLHGQSRVPVTIVRPSLTYGPSQIPLCVGSWSHPWTIIDRIRRGRPVVVPGDGTSLWVLTWNADFARGLLGLLGNPAAIGEAFHITADEVLTWQQIYLEVFAAVGKPPKILHMSSDLISAHWPHAQGSLVGDKMHSCVFDNSKIKSLVPDFACEVNWADGLRRALHWHESHPQFQTVDGELDRALDQLELAHARALPASAAG